jgi:hypothetical protein
LQDSRNKKMWTKTVLLTITHTHDACYC